MKQVFLIALDGTGVSEGHSILGFLSNNDIVSIRNYIKNMYGLTLQQQLPNEYDFQYGKHWEYATDDCNVNVHIDVCYNLE